MGRYDSTPYPANPHSTFKRSDLRAFDVFPTYLLYFLIVAHSFALTENSTLFFSIVSELFAKNHPGWGGAYG
jgi:hypothetical protein